MRVGRREVTVLAALLALGTAPAAARAQEPEEAARRGCRCVDRAGEEIERCVCVVTPRMTDVFAFSSLRRAHLGIGLDWEQGAEADRRGVRVRNVAEGSPAEEAGLRAGDVLVSVAGRHLLNPLPEADREAALDEDRSMPVQRLLAVVEELEPGEPAEVRYLRDGQERTATVVPEESALGAVARMAPRLRFFGDSMRIRGDSMWFQGDSMWFRGDSLRILGDSLRVRLWRERGAREQEARTHRHEALTHEHEVRAREHQALTREHEVRARELAERMRRDGVRLRAEGERIRALEGQLRREGQTARELALRFERPGGVVVSPSRSMRLWWPFGLELIELNPDLADYFEVDEGVLVADVAEGSELGLRPGDVIVAIDERDVDDVSDVRRILGSFEPGEDVRFRVVRRGDETTVTGHLDGRGRRDGS